MIPIQLVEEETDVKPPVPKMSGGSGTYKELVDDGEMLRD